MKAEDRAALVHLVGDDGVLLCCARRPKPDEVATDNPFMASCTSAAGKELGA